MGRVLQMAEANSDFFLFSILLAHLLPSISTLYLSLSVSVHVSPEYRCNILWMFFRSYHIIIGYAGCLHRKKGRKFPVPNRDVTTKLSLGGNNDVITELFLPRGSLVSEIPAEDGKLVNLFLRCRPKVGNRNIFLIRNPIVR